MYLQLFGGLIYLLLAGDLLVRGAVALAERAGIAPIVVGLTVVAFGTSAPELFVALRATFSGHAEIAVGNVVGSNIANVLLVMGIPALIYPLACRDASLPRETLTMLLATGLFTALCFLGSLGRMAGGVLLIGMGCFLYSSLESLRGEADRAGEAEELERLLGLPSSGRMIGLFLLLGGLGLPLGAKLFIDGAVAVAQTAGVSDTVIGLTVVAIGTSLPELATTLLAALHRHADVAVGNVLGSNVFNLLSIMGITALVSPQPLPISATLLHFDVLVMVAAALLLSAFTVRRSPIGRAPGVAFIVCYAAYVVTLLQLH